LADLKAQTLPLPGIEAIGTYSYCAFGCAGFIDTEIARQIVRGHSLHPDLQNRYGDPGLENKGQGLIQCCNFNSPQAGNQTCVSMDTTGFAASCDNLLWRGGFSSTTLCITVCWGVGSESEDWI